MPAATAAKVPGDKQHDVHPVTLIPTVSAQDVKFASVAANDGINEVKTSKMAQEKTTNESVRNFAAMMVTDHTKSGEELAGLQNRRILLFRAPGRPKCARQTGWQ